MVLETVKSLSEYLGYNGKLFNGAEYLQIVKIKEGHFCWRYKNKFVFSALDELEIGNDIKRVRNSIRDKTFGFAPSQETISCVMMKLSPIYKVFATEEPNRMSVVTLKAHSSNFINSLSHIYKTFNDTTCGVTFLEIPAIKQLLTLFVKSFYTKIEEILVKIGDENGIFQKYKNVITDTEIQSKEFALSELKRACNSTVPIVIQKNGQMSSIVFSTSAIGLISVLETCIKKLSYADYNEFRSTVLCDKVVEREFVAAPKSSPIKQKRPTIKKMPRKTWRDKRPPRIKTNLKVDMSRCPHNDKKRKRNIIQQPRKSVRIAKMNPRRSLRLKR